jgi:hypothetical protein
VVGGNGAGIAGLVIVRAPVGGSGAGIAGLQAKAKLLLVTSSAASRADRKYNGFDVMVEVLLR